MHLNDRFLEAVLVCRMKGLCGRNNVILIRAIEGGWVVYKMLDFDMEYNPSVPTVNTALF